MAEPRTMPGDPPVQAGRVALVTGASRGLGHEVAVALGGCGVHVVAVARSEGGLAAMDDRIRATGGSATLVPLDLADGAGIARLAAAVADRFGRLDYLVHAAARALPLAPVRDIDPAGAENLWRVNADSARALVAGLEGLLARSRGRARFLDDPAAGAYGGAYAASKSALRALVHAWRAERPELDIALLAPPPMATALRRVGWPGEDPAALADPAGVAADIVAELVAEAGSPGSGRSPMDRPPARAGRVRP